MISYGFNYSHHYLCDYDINIYDRYVATDEWRDIIIGFKEILLKIVSESLIQPKIVKNDDHAG